MRMTCVRWTQNFWVLLWRWCGLYGLTRGSLYDDNDIWMTRGRFWLANMVVRTLTWQLTGQDDVVVWMLMWWLTRQADVSRANKGVTCGPIRGHHVATRIFPMWARSNYKGLVTWGPYYVGPYVQWLGATPGHMGRHMTRSLGFGGYPFVLNLAKLAKFGEFYQIWAWF